MEDISGLKVADLRRELKERGLPITGTKTELVSRLQEALTSEKPTSDDSALDDALLDEDSMLAGEDDESSGGEVETSDTENLAKLGLASSPTKLTSSTTVSGTLAAVTSGAGGATTKTVPSDAKRNGTTLETDDGVSTAKKIKISRDPVQAPAAKQVTVTSPHKPATALVTSAAAGGTADEGAKKVNLKNALTAVDRSKLREEKFGSATATIAAPTASAAAAPEKLEKRAARFGITTGAPAAAAAKGTVVVSAEEEARLAKRRERFGKELSDVQETVEVAKQKRAQRFGGGISGASNKEVDEKKKLRAARFGV